MKDQHDDSKAQKFVNTEARIWEPSIEQILLAFREGLGITGVDVAGSTSVVTKRLELLEYTQLSQDHGLLTLAQQPNPPSRPRAYTGLLGPLPTRLDVADTTRKTQHAPMRVLVDAR